MARRKQTTRRPPRDEPRKRAAVETPGSLAHKMAQIDMRSWSVPKEVAQRFVRMAEGSATLRDLANSKGVAAQYQLNACLLAVADVLLDPWQHTLRRLLQSTKDDTLFRVGGLPLPHGEQLLAIGQLLDRRSPRGRVMLARARKLKTAARRLRAHGDEAAATTLLRLADDRAALVANNPRGGQPLRLRLVYALERVLRYDDTLTPTARRRLVAAVAVDFGVATTPEKVRCAIKDAERRAQRAVPMRRAHPCGFISEGSNTALVKAGIAPDRTAAQHAAAGALGGARFLLFDAR